jgi:flagellar biosynthesis/type III secretory pathway protein FliH
MAWRPRLNVVCGRCGRPREGLRHVCRSNSSRRATVKPELSFGKCGKCKKTVTNPLTHTCHPKSDFGKRKAAAARQEKARARKKRQQDKHDYQSCTDRDCQRPLCVAFKAGRQAGYQQGYEDGYETGFGAGFAVGLASCSRPHAA